MRPARALVVLGALLGPLGCAEDSAGLDGEPPPTGWALRFGDTEDDEPLALAASATGEVLVVGRFAGTIDAGGGPLVSTSSGDLLLIQLGPEGQHRWSRAVARADADLSLVRARAVGDAWLLAGAFFGRRLDLGAGAVEAEGGNTAFIARLGSDGATQWQTILPASGDSFVTEVIATDDDGAWVGGRFFGVLDAGGTTETARGSADIFLARLDAAGAIARLERHGDTELETVTGLALAPGGGLWVAGQFETRTEIGEAVIERAGGRRAFLTRVGRAPQALAVGEGDALLSQLAVAANGDLLVAGGLTDVQPVVGSADLGPAFPNDAFVARVGPELEPRFARRLFGPDFDTARGLAVTPSGRTFVAGTFRGTLDASPALLSSAGDSDGFIVELDGVGETVAGLAFGSPDAEEVVADIRPVEDGVLLLGGIEGEVDLGFGPVVSAGGFDLLVAKVSSLR